MLILKRSLEEESGSHRTAHRVRHHELLYAGGLLPRLFRLRQEQLRVHGSGLRVNGRLFSECAL